MILPSESKDRPQAWQRMTMKYYIFANTLQILLLSKILISEFLVYLLFQVYFCKMYSTCVSSKLCKFIFLPFQQKYKFLPFSHPPRRMGIRFVWWYDDGGVCAALWWRGWCGDIRSHDPAVTPPPGQNPQHTTTLPFHTRLDFFLPLGNSIQYLSFPFRIIPDSKINHESIYPAVEHPSPSNQFEVAQILILILILLVQILILILLVDQASSLYGPTAASACNKPGKMRVQSALNTSDFAQIGWNLLSLKRPKVQEDKSYITILSTNPFIHEKWKLENNASWQQLTMLWFGLIWWMICEGKVCRKGLWRYDRLERCLHQPKAGYPGS